MNTLFSKILYKAYSLEQRLFGGWALWRSPLARRAKEFFFVRMKPVVIDLKVCRLCGSKDLYKFLDLGNHPSSDAFLAKDEIEKEEPRFPLDVFLCRDCGQAQLGSVVPPDYLYCKNYPYESSTTKTGREHFFGMAKTICKRFGLGKNDLAIDMGSNVGILLGGFRARGVRVLGVDPARIMAEIASINGIETITDLFSSSLAKVILKKHGKASVITGTNVFAHVKDVDDLVTGVKNLLTDKGAMVIEAPHFLELVKNTEYDTVYHEHLSYLSIKPLVRFFGKHGMELFDVEKAKIHGGSIRFYVCKAGAYPASPAVAAAIKEEEAAGIHSEERLRRFGASVEEQKKLLLKMLQDIKSRGQKVVGVSAPAKGNTLLNYCGITTELLDYITEKAQMKVGLFTPGTHIPIYEDGKLLQDQPDYALILAWNFADEIMANLSEFKKRGGKFIIPIPKPRIV